MRHRRLWFALAIVTSAAAMLVADHKQNDLELASAGSLVLIAFFAYFPRPRT